MPATSNPAPELGRRVKAGPQEHTITNTLVDHMKAERTALVQGEAQVVLAFMRRNKGARYLSHAYNEGGDRAYNRWGQDSDTVVRIRFPASNMSDSVNRVCANVHLQLGDNILQCATFG